MPDLAQLPLVFTSQSDPCAKRHKGNSESRAAFDSILPRLKGKRLQVLRTVCDLERATLKEIVDRSKLPIQTVSGRLAELKQGGMIYGTAEVRDGCRVLAPTAEGKRIIQQ